MVGLGLFLLAGFFVDPKQYGTGSFAIGDVLTFLGLLFGLGSNFDDLEFVGAFIIAIVFTAIFDIVFWHFL